MVRRRAVVAAFLMMLLVVQGCGGGGGGGSTATGSGAAPGIPAELTDDIDPDATLRYGDWTGNDTLDPHRSESGNSLRRLYPVYDRLIHQTKTSELVPGLATEWSFTSPTTFEMKLRDGVRFHDGTTFDANAVKANIERAKTLPEGSATIKQQSAAVTSVDVLGPLQVRFNLKTPRYSLPYDLASLLGMMISPSAMKNPDLDVKPVGAGFMKIVEFKPGDRTVYERFDGYWDPSVQKLKRLEIVDLADAATRLSGVRSGQLDLTTIEANQLKQAQSAKELNVTLVDTTQVFVLQTRMLTGTPFAKVEVRQAVEHALDRKALVQNVVGIGTPTIQLFPPNDPAYNPEFGPDHYAYDPAQAKKMLAEAGYPTGVDLKLLILNRPEDVRMAEVIQQMLAAADIRIQLQVVEPTRFTLFTEGCCDLFLGAYIGRPDPLESFSVTSGVNARLHPGDLSSDRLVSLMSEIGGMELGDARTAKVREAAGVAAADAVQFPLFARQIPYVSDGCVVGFVPTSTGLDEYKGVGVRKNCGR